METTAARNTATLLQLSAYSQFFIPFGSFILPTLIWSLKKKESDFIDYNGKQAINFQLSLLLYTLSLFTIAVPTFIYAIFSGISFSSADNGEWIVDQFTTGKVSVLVIIGAVALFLWLILKTLEFFLIFYASVKNSNGEKYDFPLTIKFLK